MKPSFASSYPVRACANEAGIDYALALTWVDAADLYAARAAKADILAAYGRDVYERFVLLVDRVHLAGRVRIRRWGGDGWRRPRRQTS